MKTVELNLPQLNFQVHGCAMLCTYIITNFFRSAPKAIITTGAEKPIVLAKSVKIPEV